LPSQKQLKWSQLKVGITVISAAIILGVLVLLMSGGGLFTRKIYVISYFADANGLTPGAPVRLVGVDIGNVKSIRVVEGHPADPVEVTMKVNLKISLLPAQGLGNSAVHSWGFRCDIHQYRQLTCNRTGG